MITTEEIAVEVRKKLLEGNISTMLSGGEIDYERTDYSKPGIIIIPHTIDGEGSVRNGQINVNIHVPDLLVSKSTVNPIYRTYFEKLIALKKAVIEVLKSHYQSDAGWNWNIGLVNPPMKEPKHNEHFVSLALELTVRDRTNNKH
jgi:hypothetical protein